jgi:flagellin-like hook-associated protein FlgL
MVDRLLRGRAWIWVVGILLGGIVAMQVSLLKLNSGISRAVEASATLERQNSDLESSIARLSSGERIRDGAEGKGLIMPPAGEVQYVTVRPDRDAARAVARMRPPSDAARTLMANRGLVPGSLPAAAPGDGAAGTAPAAGTTAPAATTAQPNATAGTGTATGTATPQQQTAATGAATPQQQTAGGGTAAGTATPQQTTAGGGTATPPQTTTSAGGTAPVPQG